MYEQIWHIYWTDEFNLRTGHDNIVVVFLRCQYISVNNWKHWKFFSTIDFIVIYSTNIVWINDILKWTFLQCDINLLYFETELKTLLIKGYPNVQIASTDLIHSVWSNQITTDYRVRTVIWIFLSEFTIISYQKSIKEIICYFFYNSPTVC